MKECIEKMAFKAKEDLKAENLKKAAMALQAEGQEQRNIKVHLQENGPRIGDDSGRAEA